MKLKTRKYKYSPWFDLSVIAPSLIGLFVGLILWLCGMTAILAELFDLSRQYLTASEGLGFLVAGSIFAVSAGVVLTLHTEIVVTDEGMKIRVLIVKWMFIPWKDVLSVGVVPILGYYDPGSWYYIRVKKLTCFHQLASLSYGIGTDPVLIIYKYLDGYEDLVRIIKEHIGHNAGASRVEKC